MPNTGPLSGDGPWIFRAYYTDSKQLQNLAQWTEPWEVNHVEGYVGVEVHHLIDYERLRLFGFILTLDPVLTAQLQTPRQRSPSQRTGIPGYPCYRTVEETYTAAQTMTTSYPHLAIWLDIDDSWEKRKTLNKGYDLMVLKLTNTQIAGPKPKLFIMTALHAREYATAELNTRFGEYLVTHYDQDPDVTWLLDYHEIHLLLQDSPDGRKKAETGLLWRKKTNNNHCPNTDYRGVDLNRNFRFQWGCCNGSSYSSCRETCRGSKRPYRLWVINSPFSITMNLIKPSVYSYLTNRTQ